MALEVHSSPSSSSSPPIDFNFDFDFNHGRESPWPSSPSSPQGFGSFFLSTPTSPARGYYNDYSNNINLSKILRDSDIGSLTISTNKNKRETPGSPLLQRPPPTPQSKKKGTTLWSTFSPKRKKTPDTKPVERGRVSTLPVSKSSKREARSASPEKRRWRLKDLLLFRSASEGRGSDKDPLKKYTNKTTSKKGGVSAHELHYKANKAFSEDMRKRSFLPYKQGILGRLAVNPTVHSLAHGFGSLAPYTHQ